MMRNLPVPVSEEDIDDMFDFADKDKDGKINYRYYGRYLVLNSFICWLCCSEFGTMINPKVYKPPPKFSFRNLKKYMPQIKEMAKREGVARDKEKEKAEGQKSKADMVLQFLKDD